MGNKKYPVIFLCGSWELIEGVFIFLPQVIVFLSHGEFNQLPTESHEKHSLLIRIRNKKNQGFIIFVQYSNRRCPSPSLQWKCASPCSQHEVFTPGPSLSLWHSSSPSCFHISHDEDDKSIVAGERLLKEALNYPHCRGCVSSRCAVFITAMFTFISTCLKYVTIFIPPLTLAHPRSLLISARLCTTSRCYRENENILSDFFWESQELSQDLTC